MPKEKEPIHVSKRRRIKWTTLIRTISVVVPNHFTPQQAQDIIDKSEEVQPYLLESWKNKQRKK